MTVRLAAGLLLLLTSCGRAYSDDLVGQASIIDGDTLEIHRTRVRLWGVDAPESTQLCRGEDSLQYTDAEHGLRAIWMHSSQDDQ
jgi:endonuclease YncB( thermonuclease family)